jgi:hypothetical protein
VLRFSLEPAPNWVPRFTGGETYVHHLSVKEFRRLLEDKVRARASILVGVLRCKSCES